MFSERIFEDILVKYPELIESNLKFIGRQVNHFGKRIDILFEDRFNEKLIIELKKDNLDRNALSQVMEYEGYILSEKDPSARVKLIANRIPLNLKKAMEHHGIEYKEITQKQLLEFLESRDEQYFNLILSQTPIQTETQTQKTSSSRGNLTMASKLDEIILAGGKWEELIVKADFESKKIGRDQKYTIGILKSHIRYRTTTQRNPEYLGDLVITEEGLSSIDKAHHNPTSTPTINRKPSMAGKLDEIILAGGKWEELIAKAEKESKKMGKHMRYTIGVFKSHIRYRTVTQNNPNYLKDYMITEKGIYPKSQPKDTFNYSIKHSRRGRIIDFLRQNLSDQELLEMIDKEFLPGIFATSNKQAIAGTKRDLRLQNDKKE